jgi:DNA-binding beta-propeller fold protein YncE
MDETSCWHQLELGGLALVRLTRRFPTSRTRSSIALWLLFVGCGHDTPASSVDRANDAAQVEDAGAGSTYEAGLSPTAPAHADAGRPRDASVPAATGSSSPQDAATGQDAAVLSGGQEATDAATPDGVPTLFYLDAVGGRVLSTKTDGKKPRALVQNQRATPDGVVVDVAGGRVYWTNMGVPTGDDGTILSAKLDGSEVTTVVPSGGTFTPKQLALDAAHGFLYWSDREGMRVMRSKLDGSGLETLVATAEGDAARRVDSNWAVGIALDVAGGYVYWTQKGADNAGQGSLRRAPIALSSGEAANRRGAIEVLFQSLPEPIDLALDLTSRKVYWTDRGDNTVSRARMDLPAGATAATRTDREILVRGLSEAIGIALDVRRGDVYYTDLGGLVGTCKLDGSGAKTLLSGQGALTGITFVELPK